VLMMSMSCSGLTPPATWMTSGSSKQRTDMRYGIGGADVTEELVAKAFAFGSTLNESGDIDKLHGGGNQRTWA